jgi:peptidoglycan/xylan/chitin deacetylase (PgdA/CDA1 family)
MSSLKNRIQKIISRTFIEVLISLSVILMLGVHGYFQEENFIDNEKLGVDTTLHIGVGVNNEQQISKKSISIEATSTAILSTFATTSIPVFVYHKINKENFFLIPIHERKNFKKYNVPDDVFEAQMKYVREEGYTPLTMRQAIMDKQHNTLPRKPIVITFDDGWRSQYENALPVLKEYKIPATFYIYTNVIGGGAYMTWDNLNELVSLNMEIADHTKSHPRLTKITQSKLDEELVESRRILERKLHVPVNDFAYPYGNYNDLIIEAVKKDGYISGRTSTPGRRTDLNDLYQIRVMYAPSDLKTFQELLRN